MIDLTELINLVDLHTHILPGLDDGAESLSDAQRMLEIADRDGITRLFATPHFMAGWFEPSPVEIQAGVEQLNQYAKIKGLKVQVLSGMEVALSPEVPALLQQGRLLTLNNEGRYLLLELPASDIPLYTEGLLFDLQLRGITPVLAHPERNRLIEENPKRLKRMVERGVLVQITGDSVLGKFGRKTRQTAYDLLKAGLVHGLGSDAHSSRHRPPVLKEAAEQIAKLIGPEKTSRLIRADAIGTTPEKK